MAARSVLRPLAGLLQQRVSPAAVRFSASRRCFSSAAEMVKVVFVTPDSTEVECNAHVGDSLLDVALDNDIDIEGACGGECACSTCHVILTEELYDSLEEPDEDEEDMLDLALGLTDTSRLGCQVFLDSTHDGIRVTLPAETMNFMDD